MIGPILGGNPYLRFAQDSTVIACHGNSLVYGQSGATVPSGAMPYQLQRLAPVSNRMTCHNLGVNGQRWDQMLTAGTGAAVDALYEAGKRNILVAWEIHNTVVNAGVAAAYASMETYLTQRIATGWDIYLLTCLPARYTAWNDATTDVTNAQFEEYNDLLRTGWAALGVSGLIEVRPTGGLFDLANYSAATFGALEIDGQSVWSPADGGQWVHLSDAGYGYIAQLVADKLRTLRR